ncbi:hypothetical protein KW790_03275 [Candidatus Parcubacteria bacterium]|nr:hypothetical protein [Candidatus Parcubacteria bacterium]
MSRKTFQLKRFPGNPVLTPRPNIEWEAKAVFNPAVILDKGIFKMLYRTYPKGLEFTGERGKRPGYRLKGNISYIGYAESKDGKKFIQRDTPLISPDKEFDKFGVEDPRVTKIGDTFYITYTAIDKPLWDKSQKPDVRIALATTKDFKTVIKHGVIGPPETSKAAALFPEKVNGGKIALALTISSDSENSHIAVRYYDSIQDLINPVPGSWEKFIKNSKDTALLGTYWWLQRGPELGAPPVKTSKGWLFIFSAESMSESWTIGAALSDLNEPHKLIARTPGYILQSVEPFERDGIVPNVTFPSGAVIVKDELYVYYGSADTVISLATCDLEELLDNLEQFKGR